MIDYKLDKIKKAKAALIVIIAIGVFKLIPISYHINVGPVGEEYEEILPIHSFILEGLADSNDTVYIHVDSPGGSVNLMATLINSITNSKAHTVSINERYALSAGAGIAFATKEQRANKMSVYMFHKPWRMGPEGKQIVPNNDPAGVLVNRYLEDFAFKYFTDEEVKLYNEGEDVSIFGTDLIERIRGHKK